MSSLKIVVTGPASAGKTTFVQGLADGSLVSTEEQTTDATEKNTTTVGLDYGRVQVQGRSATLFGTPGQSRFEYLWGILGEGADGCVFLFPADAAPSTEQSSNFVQRLVREEGAPFVVGVTRADLVEPNEHPDVTERLGALAASVQEIDPRDPAQSRQLLAGLVGILCE